MWPGSGRKPKTVGFLMNLEKTKNGRRARVEAGKWNDLVVERKGPGGSNGPWEKKGEKNGETEVRDRLANFWPSAGSEKRLRSKKSTQDGSH